MRNDTDAVDERSSLVDGDVTPVIDTWTRVTFGTSLPLVTNKTYSVSGQRVGWQRYAAGYPGSVALDARFSFVGGVSNTDGQGHPVITVGDDRILGLARLVVLE